jgi:hypothetical protein
VRPVGAVEVGLLATLIGAWGAICVYIGPYFGYRPTSHETWDWTTQNWLLHLLPGAAAVVAGLMILAAAAPRRRSGTGGGATSLATLLLVAAGAWFVIGPALWPVIESGQPFATGTSAWTSFLNQVGSSLGPGLILAVLGGMAFKAVVARPRATVQQGDVVEPVGGPAMAEPAIAGQPTGTYDRGAAAGTYDPRTAETYDRGAGTGTYDRGAGTGTYDRGAGTGTYDPRTAETSDRGAEVENPTTAQAPVRESEADESAGSRSGSWGATAPATEEPPATGHP